MNKRLAILLQGTALALVAAMAAIAVVATRGPGTPPQASAQPIQVGIDAPSAAPLQELVPISVDAVGPVTLQRAELWVGPEMVESLEVSAGPSISLTMHWPASPPGSSHVRVRVFDIEGNVGTSNTKEILVTSGGTEFHSVEEPGPDTLAGIAAEAGVPLGLLTELNPGIGLDDILVPGSLVRTSSPADEDEGAPSAPPGDTPPSSLEDGVVQVDQPLDGIFLYLTFGGKVLRVPADPSESIPVGDDPVDVKPHLPPLPSGEVAVEVWGRWGGGVTLLDNLVVPTVSLITPATDLNALFKVVFTNLEIPVKSITATNKTTVEMEWASNVPHTGVKWFLSTNKPGPGTGLTPSGVLQSGSAVPQGGSHRFPIDLSKNTAPTLLPLPLLSFPLTEGGLDLRQPGLSTRVILPNLEPAGSAWAWVVPVNTDGLPVGPASAPVRIVITEAPFDPSDAPPFDVLSIELEVPPAPNLSLASCIRVISQTPPFPRGIGIGFYLNPDGSINPIGHGGTKITGTLPYTLDAQGNALYPFTACPGETGNFQWGSVGCGADPFCHVSKGLTALGNAAVALGEFLVGLANGLAEAYNQLKMWVIDQVASTLCPGAVSGPCKVLIQVAVDVLLAAVGVPPTMPEFDDLANLAKGELVDLALDQMGVGAVCDAVATAGTGKTCGELATELQKNIDACSLAPKGQEDSCRNLVEQAASVCQDATKAPQCKLATTSAQSLIKDGFESVIDQSLEAIDKQVTNAALESLGFPTLWFNPSSEHHCQWGGPNNDEVICPPWFFQTDPPPGCHLEKDFFGEPTGKVKCWMPPGGTVAVPEPLGQYQPIKIRVSLARNDNPLPEGFECGPISAVITTLTPWGASGHPYLPATAPTPTGSGFLGLGIHNLTMWAGEPNPHVLIPAEKLPPLTEPGPIPVVAVDEAGKVVGGNINWKFLLAGGSAVGVRVSGECIPETSGGGELGIAGLIPHPQPRITPGAP